ncbi:MAG: dihydrodipicolinate synthase family protein, partial [Acidobacteriota bacterium]
ALTRWAGELGADFAMVVTPNYYKPAMKPEILRAHYHEVADKSTIPIVLYNVPIFTMLNMSADLVTELASHPNIVGIKDSSGDMLQLQEICRRTRENFPVLTGSGSLLLASLAAGAGGAILAVANVAYDLCVDIVDAFDRGDWNRARKLQYRLTPINQAVTVEFGIAGLKALLDKLDFYGGPPRSPLQRATPEIQRKILGIYQEAHKEETGRS